MREVPFGYQYQSERLVKILRKNAGYLSEMIRAGVLNLMKEFTGDFEQFDDITIVIIKDLKLPF